MTRKLEIEAALERSLRRKVAAPQLDGRFDAAVWSRIEAEEQRAPKSRGAAAVPASARWLFISNVIGAAVAFVLIAYFGVQSFGSVEVPTMSVPTLSVPAISASAMDQFISVLVWSVTGASLAIALMCTSVGRRLRAEFF
jgi:cytochrome c-type biogenesis protein CcmH/NrfG